MIRITDQYFWNVVFGVFFCILLALGVIILETEAYRSYDSLTFMDVILLALATHRAVRLFVYDAITKFFREQFYDVTVGKHGEVILHKPPRGPRRTIADLMTCPWCFGMWAGASLTFFYLLTPYTHFLVLFLAVASLGSTFQIFTNLMGHKAEQVKRENEGL